MTIEHQSRELRSSPRHRRSEAIFWKLPWFATYEMGWLLEASESGCAFAWRGAVVPALGSRVDVDLEPASSTASTRAARVQRVELVHDDLVLIACEFVESLNRKRSARPARVVRGGKQGIVEAESRSKTSPAAMEIASAIEST